MRFIRHVDRIKAGNLATAAYVTRVVPISRTITFAAPSATLTNFPVLVKANATFGIATSTGYDVHFQDMSGNELYFDLDYYDPVTGNGAWWVQIPSLPSTGPTSIKMLYGDSSVTTNGSAPSTVWSDYAYVYHFNDLNDLSSVIGSYTPTDASHGGITGTLSLVSNPITGRGMNFHVTGGYGSNYYGLYIANAINTSTATFTVYGTTTVIGGGDREVIMDTGWTTYAYRFNGVNFIPRAGGLSVTIPRATAGQWYMYGASTKTGTLSWVVNGDIQSSSGTAGQFRWDGPKMTITGQSNAPTEIILDELRISTTTYKSEAWLQYEQKILMDHSNYVTYGSEVKG